MSELAICEHFKWTLDYIRNLDVKDYLGIVRYMKKLNMEQKRAMRKAKSRGGRR